MKFYITTAIDYPNSVPHMGHAFEKVLADFYARWHRLRGDEVRFLIGLDEHGEKIQEAAREAGRSPQEFVDQRSETFLAAYRALSISNDDFIRTSTTRHHRFVSDFYRRVEAAGDTYKGFYQGDYCVACEAFYTPTQLVEGRCPVHGTPTSRVKEESYFFRLGKYRDWLRDHLRSHPDFVFPEERRNELLSRLEEDVRDLSISRSTFNWGIPVPGDPRHVIYVWFDALVNYLSALKEPQDVLERYWPADVHVIGKDILWFHTAIWPCMLHSAGYPLPRQVLVHGFVLDPEGRRMSKTLGNVVDPLEVTAAHGAEVLRYYVLRAFGSGQDGAFSLEELRERYQNELANDLGNLVMRVAKLVSGKLAGRVEPRSGLEGALDFTGLLGEYARWVEAREHPRALDALWAYVRRVNAYLNDRAPWKEADPARLQETLYNALEALRAIAHLLSPVMPATAESIASSLGFSLGKLGDLRFGSGRFTVTLRPPLFPRLEESRGAAGAPAAKSPEAPAAARQAKAAPLPAAAGDPFSALEIRVGVIAEVREHPGADSLYAMTVDLGGGDRRSICAGLRKHLTLEELQGRKVAVLANLKPAKLRGIESRGMVLATDRKDGKVAPVDPGQASPGDLVTAEGVPSAPRPKITIEEFAAAPLEIQGGRVVYRDPAGSLHRLSTPAGDLRCDAEDGARVR